MLEQIRARRLRGYSGVYLGDSFNALASRCPSQLQGELKQVKDCKVYALGSLLFSRTNLFNELTGSEVTTSGDQQELCRTKLADVFTPEQLQDIEASFGGWGYAEPWYFYFASCEVDADDTARLRRVCRNIIRNNGVFEPAKEVDRRFLKYFNKAQKCS